MKLNHFAALLLAGGILAGCTDEKVILPDVADVPTVSPQEEGTRQYDNSWEMPDEMPIIAWLGVPSRLTSTEQFTYLKDCGININYTSYSSENELDEALELANEVGIQILPLWERGFLTLPDYYVPFYDDDPALFAYFITDEPTKKSEFATFQEQIANIRATGAKKPIYINLVGWPSDYNCEHWGFDDQQDYLDTCIDTFDPPMISSDLYPLTKVSEDSITVSPNWFKYLEMSRETSIKTGKPFWAFVRCGANDHRPVPTLESMRLLASVDLAYGAQAIEYYSYRATGSDYACPINSSGVLTDTYYYVKELNEEIRALEKYFYKGTVTKVVHVTTEYEDITINYAPEGAIVSLLTSPEGKNYIVLVNKSYRENMSVSRRGVDYDILPGDLLLLDRD